MPLFNERARLPALIQQLQVCQADKVVFVDGGSDDGSWQWLQNYLSKKSTNSNEPKWQCVQSEVPGRATQMNLGAACCETDILIFLHADTTLPDGAISLTRNQLSNAKGLDRAQGWGFFRVRFLEQDWRMRVIAWCINQRSRLTSVATGDQVQFVNRELFVRGGGFQEIELMEDIALSKSLRKLASPIVIKQAVQTSARRWLQAGVIRTVLLMWLLRLGYFLGISPDKLASFYRQVR